MKQALSQSVTGTWPELSDLSIYLESMVSINYELRYEIDLNMSDAT